MSAPETHLRPALADNVTRQTDPLTGGAVLLYPEGIVELNETAAEIVARCDGEATVADIAARLAEEFEAPSEALLADVSETLAALARRQLIVLRP